MRECQFGQLIIILQQGVFYWFHEHILLSLGHKQFRHRRTRLRWLLKLGVVDVSIESKTVFAYFGLHKFFQELVHVFLRIAGL